MYDVTDQLIDFMGGGQPYQRFQSAQEEKREAAKVDRVITVQRLKSDKPKYEMDIKKEALRFKQTFKLAEKDQLPRSCLQVDLFHFHPPYHLTFVSFSRFQSKLWRRKGRKGGGERRKLTIEGGLSKIVSHCYFLKCVLVLYIK